MDPKLLNKEVTCEVCKQVHRYGDPAWRDCQQKLFDQLVEHTEEWRFQPTQEQIDRVKNAHEAYMTEFVRQGVTKNNPDLHAIRLMVVREFDQESQAGIKALTKFWEEFQSDMPEPFKDKNFRHSIAMAWSDHKLIHILRTMNLPFVEWDQKELTCNMKLPDSLRAAAAGLDSYTAEGWRLYHFETEQLEGTTLAKYYLRRPKSGEAEQRS